MLYCDRASPGSNSNTLLLRIPNELLDKLVKILIDERESFWLMVSCKSLRASVLRCRLMCRFSGLSGGSTTLSSVFDSTSRRCWAFDEAYNSKGLERLRKLYEPFDTKLENLNMRSTHSIDDFKLTLQGVRACAMSKTSTPDLLRLMGCFDGDKSWMTKMDVVKVICYCGRIDMMKAFFAAFRPIDASVVEDLLDGGLVGSTNELHFMTEILRWRQQMKEFMGMDPTLTTATHLSNFPTYVKTLKWFKTHILKPAAVSGHVDIWKEAFQHLSQCAVIGGLTLKQWGSFLVSPDLWTSIVASGKFIEFWKLLSVPTTTSVGRIFCREAMPPLTAYERMGYCRSIDLAAVVAVTESSGVHAEPWEWLVNYVRSVGDMRASNCLEILLWMREYASVAGVQIAVHPLFPTRPMVMMSELPMVQSMRVYDFFLKESYEGGFFYALMVENLNRALPRGGLDVLNADQPATMKTHGEALFGYVVLEFWARWVGEEGSACGGMNDELASVLERAAFAVISCHEFAFTGAILATVAMRGYSVARLREVVKRAQDVLLDGQLDGSKKLAMEKISMKVQGVVTVPMMARAALCSDTVTWEWCIAPKTARRRPIPYVASFSRGHLMRFMGNATKHGTRSIVTWCANQLQRRNLTVTKRVVLNLLSCPNVADLALPYLKNAVKCGRSLRSIGDDATDLSPEAITVCIEAGVYQTQIEQSLDGQFEVDLAFRVAHMQKHCVRKAQDDRITRLTSSNEGWIAMRYRYYRNEVRDVEDEWLGFYEKPFWDISDCGGIR